MSGNTHQKMIKRNTQKKKNKADGLLKGGILIGLAAVMGISGTMAYLTDYTWKDNQFKIGNVDIELEEPSFDTSKPMENIVPTQVIKKDPMIENTGANEAYVFMEVTVPYLNMVVVGEDGKCDYDADFDELFSPKPLFTYEANTEDWLFIKERNEIRDTDDIYSGCKVFYYAYKKPLAPGETTSAIFDTVTVANFEMLEGFDFSKPITLGVQARAIQSENTGGDSENPEDQVRHAFTVYFNQDPETIK